MRFAVIVRLIVSVVVAFFSYATWAYYANSLVTNDHNTLMKAALVQGVYSGGITLFFTLMLEFFYSKFGQSTYCLGFIVPRINKHSPSNPCSTLETFKASLALSKQKCQGTCIPGAILSPIPALLIQSTLVIAVNIAFATPNLWLTVAPSIIFSAIYGYAYSLSIARK